MRASHGNLADREVAECLLLEAAEADRRATRHEATKVAARGGGRAVTMRTRYRAVMTNRRDLARFLWGSCPEQFDPLLLRLAQDFVNVGRHSLPGVEVIEDRTAQ